MVSQPGAPACPRRVLQRIFELALPLSVRSLWRNLLAKVPMARHVMFHPAGNGGIQGKAPEIPQEDASVDGVDIKPSSHSDGGLRVAASHGIAPRMASIP